MDSKVRLPDSFNPEDVAPLPSAPPPSYDDAMGTSSSYGGVGLQQNTPVMTGIVGGVGPHQYKPVMTENPMCAPPQPLPYPVQPSQPQPYPVQQVQITPVGAALPNRYLPVGRHPLKTTCTGCNKYISTRTRSRNNCNPTFWCIVLFMTGMWCCCCCPYFFCNNPYEVDHFCPNCNAFLGTYHN